MLVTPVEFRPEPTTLPVRSRQVFPIQGKTLPTKPPPAHLVNLSPEGQVLRTVSLPDGRLPIACAVGGNENNTLFVASNTGLGPGMALQRDGRIEMFSIEGLE